MKAKELAKLLGVSPATVSLVLNNKPGVSDGLREELLKKIREMGCEEMIRCGDCDVRDSAALSVMRNGGRQVVLYLIYTGCDDGSGESAFFPRVLRGAEAEARENGWELIVLHMDEACREDRERLRTYADRAVGAVAQVVRVRDCAREEFEALGIPVVFVDACRRGEPASSVCVHNEQAMYDVVRYLKAQGHEQIGYVSLCEGDSMDERRGCFYRALMELGLRGSLAQEGLFSVPEDVPRPREALEAQFRNAKKLPTALVCDNDNTALQTLKALRAMGLRVPEDVSLVGFDNRSLCELTDPPLTSVKNDAELMGRECVLLLKNLRRLRRLGRNDVYLKTELPVELVIRQSVGKLEK